MATLTKVCNLCNQATLAEGVDLLYFGEWMNKTDITVHYYCLLLSTHLPQQGADNSGILGFLLQDIRKEARMAKSRRCIYCDNGQANIMCHGCNEYFHLTCGFTSLALSQFRGQFHSYCHKCIPHDAVWEKLKIEKPPLRKYKCFICMEFMGTCQPSRWIYAKCCRNGFVHSRCMKSYALKAGYYLCCIWCKDKRFREDVKDMGVFVPDRDANWEREEGAYQDLHRGHRRCDMDVCHCPKGRDYRNGYRWPIILCQLCGSFGAHNPKCVPGMESENDKVKEFKCETCSTTERSIFSQSSFGGAVVIEDSNGINTTLYIKKDVEHSHCRQQTSGVEFSDDSNTSMITVVNAKLLQGKSVLGIPFAPEKTVLTPIRVDSKIAACHIPTLTQCEESTEKQPRVIASLVCQSEPLGCTKDTIVENNNISGRELSENKQNTAATDTNSWDSESQKPDPKAIEMLVGRMLDLFES